MSAAADKAIAHLLRRIVDDPRIAYYFVHTESLALMIAAHAEAIGRPAIELQREFDERIETERPRCRGDECHRIAEVA